MFILDLEGKYISINQTACNSVGYSQEEMLYQHFNKITHPDDIEKSRIKYQELIEGKCESYRFEKRYIHKDGHVVWGLSNVFLVRDAQGNPAYSVAQFQDFTGRKIAESKLKESENRFKDISNSMVDLIWEVDTDFNFIYLSDHLVSFFKYTHEEVMGKCAIDYAAPHEHKCWLHIFRMPPQERRILLI